MASKVGPPDPQEPQKPQGNQGPTEKWLSDLARRSTGLPGDQAPPPKPEKGDKSLWTFAGLGLQLAATTAIFAFIGNAIDKWMGWSPWGLVTLALLAVIGNLYLLIKESLKEEKRPPAK